MANAIDNQPTKYLNFDAGDGTTPVGFVVTPSVGATVVTGLSIQSANDAPDRDPLSIRLEGSNDTAPGWDSGNWTVIYENPAIESWTSLFPDGDRFQTQVFGFENLKPYLHYRFTVISTQGPSTCCFQAAEIELLGETLAPDVTQPGDPIIASSDNSPGSEGVANIIDNQPTKYLNFDAGDGTTPVGFVVSPSIGSTLVNGISIQSANDAPDRDVRSFRLEGSNDEAPGWDSGNWTLIYENTAVEAWTDLFPGDDRFQTQTFLFPNVMPYQHYRFTVVATQGPSTCCFQAAEIQLHGGGAPRDVTQPGDVIVASSSNSPGSEGVANAIDNQPTKYLNFDAGDGTTPTGFVVTPQVGPSKVVGMTIMSANDAPDRDVKWVRLEGSNDEAPGWDSGNWTLIYENDAVEPWTDLFPGDDRFQTQAFYFENDQEFRHYRWTAVATQGPSTCCMQVAEVELLAQLASNPCEQVAFITPPVDTPVLEGESATFFTEVNGPWSLQWYKNGDAIPGATQSTYTTDPVTAANADDTYSVEIVGCVFSQPVKAVIFTPSDTISYGLNFLGGGANGAPTAMAEADIAGFWPQAHWNNVAGAAQTGMILTNSNGGTDLVTVTFTASGTWGAGTGTDSADQRMLNGLVQGSGDFTFENVPDGTHSIIAYSVARPLEFPDINLTVDGTTIYGRQMNADEYNPAPGFYSMSSTDPGNRSVGNMTRFDGITPASGQIMLHFEGPGDGNATINGLQLILDAPALGAPPAITTQPASQNVVEGRRAILSVEATGENLSYQWRKDGFTLFDGNGISGATTATLSITGFGAGDEGRYDVAIANPAGTVVSSAAALHLWTGEIGDRLAGHWKLDETSGNSAADSANGNAADLRDFFAPGWVAGQIGNGLSFDGVGYGFVENYPKAESALGVSLWMNLQFLAGQGLAMPLVRNWGDSAGQFTLGYTGADVSQLQAQVRIGPNTVTAGAETPDVQPNSWHHVAFSADGARLTLYLDGQVLASTDYFGDFNSPPVDFLSIGGLLDDSGAVPVDPANFYGVLDDIGIWTRALSAAEVQAIYDAGMQGKDLSTVVVEVPEQPEITSISIDPDGNVVIEFIGTLVHSDTVNGTYTEVPGATSPYIATQTGFYQAKQ